jgi:hypothetical protein
MQRRGAGRHQHGAWPRCARRSNEPGRSFAAAVDVETVGDGQGNCMIAITLAITAEQEGGSQIMIAIRQSVGHRQRRAAAVRPGRPGRITAFDGVFRRRCRTAGTARAGARRRATAVHVCAASGAPTAYATRSWIGSGHCSDPASPDDRHAPYSLDEAAGCGNERALPWRGARAAACQHWCRRRDSNPYGVAPNGF